MNLCPISGTLLRTKNKEIGGKRMVPQCITAGVPTAPVDRYDLFMRGERTLPMNNIYATIPMIAVEAQSARALSRPVSPDTGEEELHTSFEQAISDRLLALNSRLQRITRSTDPAFAPPSPGLQARARAHAEAARHSQARRMNWHHPLLLANLALMFLLLGFDVMGLLVLYLH